MGLLSGRHSNDAVGTTTTGLLTGIIVLENIVIKLVLEDSLVVDRLVLELPREQVQILPVWVHVPID